MTKTRERNNRQVIAVAGKGGTGKTTTSAIIAKLLRGKGLSVLAVDADPPISLAYALGVEPIRTVGEMRAKMIEDPGEKRRIKDKHMAEVIKDELVLDAGGIDLLVLGQPEAAGCFCALNELLKFGIDSLSRHYDVTLIDCEAGIEQINRRAVNSLDTLIMVSDSTLKGVRTAGHLKDIAEKYGVLGDYRTGLLFNRVDRHIDDLEKATAALGLDVWGRIPVDENVARYDQTGKPTIDLPDDSPSVTAIAKILQGWTWLPSFFSKEY